MSELFNQQQDQIAALKKLLDDVSATLAAAEAESTTLREQLTAANVENETLRNDIDALTAPKE